MSERVRRSTTSNFPTDIVFEVVLCRLRYKLSLRNLAEMFLVESKYSCGAGIGPEQASRTLPAFNAIGRAGSVSRLREQQDVSLPLMRALGMKIRNVLVESAVPKPRRTG